MGLTISNKATARQREILKELEYAGRGKYALDNLTLDDASNLIDELFTQKKMTLSQIQQIAGDWYHMPIQEVAGITPEEFDDPFNIRNKEMKQ